jgi:YfiH family protein
MNLALHVGDDTAAVLRNREHLRSLFGLPDEPVWLEQVHGTSVVKPDRRPVRRGRPPRADAAWTDRAGVVCCVMTADCLPVLLCDTAGTRVGIAHAGWRGLAGGVIEATAAAMLAEPGATSLMAWLGPAISPAAYEVGPEVRAAFVESEPTAAGAFQPNAHGRWQADLYALAGAALERAGVTRIFGGGFCTQRDARRFFSHRREAPCGRMASLIWLKSA